MIKVEHLTKCYGDLIAVRDLSFEIGEGHVYGFLGPNGAGKSTTMNIMTGCLSATEGNVLIDGHDIYEEPETAKSLIGYLPEQPPLYMNETPLEYLRFVGEAKGLKGAELKQQMEEAVSQAGIGEVKNRLISTLSKGFKQRVGIAQALLGNPKVIILDEPTVGLDPIQIIEIRDLIHRLGQTHTVIFSSHILSEVQAICEQVLIISGGRLVAFDTPENLEKMMSHQDGIFFKTEADKETTEDILKGSEFIENYEITSEEDATSVHVITGDSQDIREISCALFFAFAEKERAIFEMYTRKANLEEVFIELTEGAGNIPGMPEIVPDDSTETDTEESEVTEE